MIPHGGTPWGVGRESGCGLIPHQAISARGTNEISWLVASRGLAFPSLMEGIVTHQPTSSLPRRRTLATLAAAFSIALAAGLTSACLEAPEPEDDVETFAFLA